MTVSLPWLKNSRRAKGYFLFFMVALFLDRQAFAAAKPAEVCGPLMVQIMKALPIEYSHLKPKTVRDYFIWSMKQPDVEFDQERSAAGRENRAPERRLKFETAPDRKADTADPVREMELTGAGGAKTWRVYSSGGRRIVTHTQDDQYRGIIGSRARRKIEGYVVKRVGGAEANLGIYSVGDFGWDMQVIVDPAGKQVGYAGLMAERKDQIRVANFNELPDYFDPVSNTQRKYEMVTENVAGEEKSVFVDRGAVDVAAPPSMASDNHGRSRVAFDITYEKDGSGRTQEVWREHGPVFPGKPTAEQNWIYEDFHHGYGGRPILGENNKPWLDPQGYMWMMLERVTEQKTVYVTRPVVISGQPQEVLARQSIPYKTETVAVRMKDAYRAFRRGELMADGREGFGEYVVSTVTSSDEARARSGKDYYPATVRDYAANGEPIWFLREGGANVGLVEIEGKKFWIKSESTGNYVSKAYNVVLSYRSYAQGPVGPYRDITTDHGDLKKFFSELGELGITWGFGRADFTFDAEGRFWFRGHGLLASDYPKWYPMDGWPPAEIFSKYFRRQILVPAHWRLVGGEPQPIMSPIKITATNIEKYLQQKKNRRRHGKNT